MERPSKEHILREIRRLAAENAGEAVGEKRFGVITGIKRWDWKGRYWARWSDAVREAGFEPGEWGAQVHDDDELLRILAELTREYGHLPTDAELMLSKRTDADTPHTSVYRKRFGGRAVLHEKLTAFADSNPDFADVAELLAESAPVSRTKAAGEPQSVVTGVVYLIRMGEFHKIGKSNDPGRRSYELGLRLPEKHDVEHVIETDDPSGIEAYWHRRFASQRSNGEWFRLSPGDVAAFRRRSYM